MKIGLRRLCTTLAVGCTPLALCAQAKSSPERIKALAGCYSLTRGAWTGGSPANGAAQIPPSTFRLDTTAVARRGPEGFVVEPTNLVSSTRPLTAWRAFSDNFVSIVWSTGFVGVTLSLNARGDTLIGVAQTFQDFIEVGVSEPTAPVVAVRVPCAPR